MTSLTQRGYGIPKDYFTETGLQELRDILTATPRNMMMDDFGGENKSFKLYLESPTKIYIPKSYGLKNYGIPETQKMNEGLSIDIEFQGKLRPVQEAPVEAFLKACKDPGKLGGLLNLPCAFGKTCLALYIIAHLKKKTLVVCHKEFLIEQWKERISQFLPGARVGIIKAKSCDIEDKDIVIGSLQSLTMKKYDPAIFNDFGFAVYDEVHHLGAAVFSRVFRVVPTRYSLGLSATLTRKDGLTKVFKWFIGDVVFKGKIAKDNMKIIMKEYFSSSHLYSREHTLFNKKPNSSKMINNICAYEPRIDYIITLLKNIIETEPLRKILVLSDRRKHLEQLQESCAKNGIGAGLYYGGLKQEVLLESETKQVLLGTYNYISEGFDNKELNTLVLASPKADVVQVVGRILRTPKAERKYQPLVLDIVDRFSMFKNQGSKRKKFYESQGYEVEYEPLFQNNTVELTGRCHLVDDEELV